LPDADENLLRQILSSAGIPEHFGNRADDQHLIPLYEFLKSAFITCRRALHEFSIVGRH
jgi:hypothetical protein